MRVLISVCKALACLVGFLLSPYAVLLLLLWSPIAWILDLIFPRIEFYPINKAWPIINDWMDRTIGIDLNTILLMLVAFLFLNAAVSWIAGLFSGKK